MTSPSSRFSIFSAPLNGAHLIDASAGTGKTYTISALFVRLLLEKKLTVSDILVVTYTKAATEDLRTRIREMIRDVLSALEEGSSSESFISDLLTTIGESDDGKQRLREALRNFDEAAVFTIHGFCQRMLRENGLESSILFDTELVADTDELLHGIAMDFWRLNINRCSPGFIRYAVKKMAPGSLCNLMKKYRKDLILLPDIDEGWVGEFLEKREGFVREEDYRIAFQELQKNWQTYHQEIKDIFLVFEGFNQSTYKKTNVPGYLDDMDRLCARQEVLPGSLPKSFTKFSFSTLQRGTKIAFDPPEHPFFDQCELLWALDTELGQLYQRLLFGLQQGWLRYGAAELRIRKEKRNIVSFDDLLVLLNESLGGRNGKALAATIRNQYPAALIDEFQDTDPVQYSIFSFIYTSVCEQADNVADSVPCDRLPLLYIIGDPKQAIYSFRGADIFTYKHAISEIGSGHSLEYNYRSVPGLIDAVNAIFSGQGDPFCDDDISFAPVKAAKSGKGACETPDSRDELLIDGASKSCFQLRILENLKDGSAVIPAPDARERIVQDLAQEISRLLNKGASGQAKIGDSSVSPQDIAVLVRTNREAQLVKDALAACNVASVLQGTGDLFLSREAWELERVLEAVADPGSDRKIRSALATDLLGGCVHDLVGIDNDQKAWMHHMTAFHRYHDLWESKGFIRMLRTLLISENVHYQCLRFADGERRLTNILHLGEVLHGHEKEKRGGISGLLQYLSLKRQGGEQTVEEHQLRLESDADRVQIVTIHRAKGLQYPIVFCPFSWGGSQLKKNSVFLFHEPEKEMKLVLELGSNESDAHLELARSEELAENIRLLYVALTRAKHRCYLYWGIFKGAERSSLAWVLHRDGKMTPAEAVGRYKKMSHEDFLEDLQPLLERSKGNIAIQPVAEKSKDVRFNVKQEPQELTNRIFNTKIAVHWKVTSFSGMTRHGGGAEMPDRDFAIKDNEDGEPMERFMSIFSFPRGAGPGTFMHDLLEHLDFGEIASRSEESVEYVRQKLQQYGYGAEWTDIIMGMLEHVVTTPLVGGNPSFVLSRVQSRQRLPELEFYFPLKKTDHPSLQRVLAEHGVDARVGKKLNFQKVEGFLKGYIDLVFEYEGRYYIVDWKSNHLGYRVDNYRAEELSNVMAHEAYTLQYLLYTVALHQYLKYRIPSYQYEEYFGGVFYLFLRGVNPDSGPSCGIYHDVPDLELINDLSAILVKE
jgi:exodeoxyribonuclease V beta subunit